MPRCLALLAVLALALGACDDDAEPDAPPAPTSVPAPVVDEDSTPAPVVPFLAVVLAAGADVPEVTLDAQRAAVADVAGEVDLPVAVSLGTTVAARRDLMELALDEGAVMACVVGVDAVRTAGPMATSRPDARICAIAEVGAVAFEVPDGLLALLPREREVAAAIAAGAVAVAPQGARIALVVEGGDWRSVLADEVDQRAGARAQAEAEALAAEQAAAAGDAGDAEGEDGGVPPPALPEVARVSTTVVADTLEGAALGRVLRDAPAWLAVVDDAVVPDELRVGSGGRVLLAGPDRSLPDGPDVLLAWSHDLRPALRLAAAAAVDPQWRPGTVTLGRADGALDVEAGGAEPGPTARRAADELLAGFAGAARAGLPPPLTPSSEADQP